MKATHAPRPRRPRKSTPDATYRGRRRALAEHLEARTLLAAQPLASIQVAPEVLIGETSHLRVTFDNTSPTDTGYGPYVDLYLPATGADGAGAAIDDGIRFASAAYFGTPVTSTVLTFNASGQATHPYAVDPAGNPLTLTGTPGDQVAVLQLPFGSFAPNQPPAPIDVSINVSNLADVGTPLSIRAVGGFRFGNDALNNPATDPSVVQSPASTASVTPTLFTLKKTYIGPEDETTTGPNFPRQYQITVDLANGQTLTDLDLTDILPPTLQFQSVAATTVGGSPATTTAIATPSTITPGGTLTRRFASVTGTTAANDAVLLFNFYVPRDSATSAPVLNPTTGDDVTIGDDARASGSWTPIDPRDPAITAISDTSPVDHILTAKSVAIQKSVAILNDTGAPGPSPGDTLEYTLNFQVSDYFAFRNLIVSDIFSDGQRVDASFLPTLRVTEHNATSSGNFTPGRYTLAVDSPGTGTSTATFNVSGTLLDRGLDALLLGGAVPNSGTGGPPPPAIPGFGATTGTIVFRTIIQEDFSDTFPSGDASVDAGDTLSNSVLVSAELLSPADLSPIGTAEDDASSAAVVIVTGSLTKSIYAINGNTSFTTPVRIAAGDTVTYRLRYSLPTSDVEQLRIDDFLPLPIFAASSITSIFDLTSATPPAPGSAQFGPTDTFRALSGIVPPISTNPSSNSLSFLYGSYDSPANPSTLIDLLFTVTVSSNPFADGLFLTNQAQAVQGSTNAGISDSTDIIHIELTEPALTLRKGVVATDRPTAIFSPAAIGPIVFSAPGSAGYRGAATITSNGLAANPINSNLRGVDAGDRVTFAIVVENTGSGLRGAFDIRLRDTLPAGFAIPSGGLNLFVSDGTGTTFSTIDLGGGLFGTGLEIVDPGPTPTPDGALDPANPTSGRNVLILTYDLQVTSAAQANQALLNTATLFNYATLNGGPDFTTQDLTDTATVTLASPTIAKSLVSTEINTTGNSSTQAVIGELIAYTVTLTVPEGVTPGATIVDTLDAGLAFVDFSPGFTNSNSGAVTHSGSSTPAITNSGGTITFNLGAITNTDTNNATPETLTFSYRVVVLNTAANQSGQTRNNSARLSFTGGSSTTASAANVTIIEPQVNVTKSALVNGVAAPGDAGDPIDFTITIRNTGPVDAFDVTFSDLLPQTSSGTSAILGTPAGSPPAFTINDTAGLLTAADFAFIGSAATGWTLQSNPGVSFDLLTGAGRVVTINLSGVISSAATPGTTFTNTARAPFTSLDGNPGQRSTFNAASNERDGSGGVNDYVGTASAPFSTRQLAPVKSIVTTSEAHTGSVVGVEQLAIGEIVRYRLALSIPEGTLPNLQIVDLLPQGLLLIDPSQVRVSFLANNDITESADLAGADNDATPPTYVLPAARIGTVLVGSRQSVTFSLGDLVNNDSDPDAEQVIIEFNALVDNSTTGSNDNGDTRDNSYSVLVAGSPSGPSSNSVPALIVEPLIHNLTKASSSPTGDAGDLLTHTLTFSNTGTAAAFDVLITDLLPSTLILSPASIVITLGNGASGAVDLSTSTSVIASIASVPVGGTVQVAYQATIDVSASVGTTILNAASLTYTSLPGPSGTTSNPTGSTTPGASGTSDGERNGSSGLINDYADADNASVTVSSPSLAKSITATNLTNTTGFNTAIGEQVVYRLIINVPEGTSPNALLTDLLPPGLAILSIDSLDASPGLSTSTSAGFAAVLDNARANIPAGGGSSTFDFATLTNADTHDATPETITISYTVVVLNTVANQAGTTLVNAASFTTTSTTANATAPALTVVEPVLTVSKTVDTASADAGATPVTFTLVVSHDPTSSADAHDVTLRDVVPTGFDIVPGSLQHTAGATPTSLQTLVNTLTITFDTLALGTSSTFQFQAVANGTTTPGQTLTNTLDATYTSLPGAISSPQSPFDGLSTERTGNPADIGGSANDYRANDSASVTLNTNSLSGFVYDDRDNDGIFDSSDNPIANVEITLTGTDNLGNPISLTVTTDPAGFYHFDALRPGTYEIHETQPNPWLDGRDTLGTQGGSISSNDTFAVTLPAATSTNGTNNNFAELAPASLSGFVYVDANNNAAFDPTESGIPGVTVTLNGIDDLGTPVQLTALSAPDGSFLFASLRPGTYEIHETQPTLYVDGPETLGTLGGILANDQFTAIPVATGDAGVNYLFGERATADLSLTKTVDTNRPGVGETVTFTITLTNAGPSATQNVAVSDALPAGLTFVSASASQGNYDDRAGLWTVGDLANGQVEILTIGAVVDTTTTAVNVAQVATSSEPDIDSTPGNSIPGEDDQAIAAINPQVADLTLTKTVDDTTPLIGQTVQFTLTVTNDGPDPATNVAVRDNLPVGLQFVTASPSQGGYDPNNGTWFVGTLAPGQSATLLLDAIVTLGGTTTNTAQVAASDQYDPDSTPANANPSEDDQAQVTLIPPAALSGSVYIDLDNDGQRQPNESGIPGVTLTLSGTDDLGNSVLLTSTTDPLGHYTFDGLSPGTYSLAETQPVLYGDGVDSLGTAGGTLADDLVSSITLTSGQNATAYDFGERGASIAGSVFVDDNNNAVREPSEPGIPGVTILLTGTDANGNPVSRSTITDADGLYLFEALPAGTYTLTEIQPPDYADGGESPGTGGGTAPGNDQIQAITLQPGQLAFANAFGELPPASLSGYVYYDLNHNRVRDSAIDLGINGVTIRLSGIDRDGNPVNQTTTTNADGFYRFANLRPGTYAIAETQPPFFRDYAETIGSFGGVRRANDVISQIPVGLGGDGVNYNFGELQPPGCNLRKIALSLANNQARLFARRTQNPARFDRNHPGLAPFFNGRDTPIYRLLPTLGQHPISLRTPRRLFSKPT